MLYAVRCRPPPTRFPFFLFLFCACQLVFSFFFFFRCWGRVILLCAVGCRQVKRTTKVKVFTEHTRVHKSCLERTKWKKFGLAQVYST